MIDFNKIENDCKVHNGNRLLSNYFLGSIFGIYDRNGKIFGSEIGFANLQKTKEINNHSIFRIASMTKPICCVAFMQQVEKGFIDLDTPIYEFIPEYKNMRVSKRIEDGKIVDCEEAVRPVTPRMLLSHSSGIGCGMTEAIQSKYALRNHSLKESVLNYAKSILEFQPGTSKQYSAVWGFDVCAYLVELLSGVPYDEYLRKNIFEPLGMSDTSYFPNEEQLTRVVDFVKRADSGFEKMEILPRAGFFGFGEGWASGGAGLFSTIEDYSRFARMLLSGGKLNAVKILEKSTVDLISQNQKICSLGGEESKSPWGLGVHVRGEQNGTSQPLPMGSFGWSGAFGTHFWIDKKNDIACVYLMNLSNGKGSGEPASLEFERSVMTGISD